MKNKGGETIRHISGDTWEEKPGVCGPTDYFFWKAIKSLIKSDSNAEAIDWLRKLVNHYDGINKLMRAMKLRIHRDLEAALERNRDAIVQRIEFVQNPTAFTEDFFKTIHKYRRKDLEEIEISDEGLKELRSAWGKLGVDFAGVCKKYGLTVDEGNSRALFDYDGR